MKSALLLSTCVFPLSLWHFCALHSCFSCFLGEKDVIILGDFNQPPDSSDHDILRKEKFHHLVPSSTFTNISTKSPQGSKSLDNIWISRSLKKVFTGSWCWGWRRARGRSQPGAGSG